MRDLDGSSPSAVMGDVFAVLVGEIPGLVDGDEIRSLASTDTCDVLLRGHWYRLTLTECDDSVSREDHSA